MLSIVTSLVVELMLMNSLIYIPKNFVLLPSPVNELRMLN